MNIFCSKISWNPHLVSHSNKKRHPKPAIDYYPDGYGTDYEFYGQDYDYYNNDDDEDHLAYEYSSETTTKQPLPKTTTTKISYLRTTTRKLTSEMTTKEPSPKTTTKPPQTTKKIPKSTSPKTIQTTKKKTLTTTNLTTRPKLSTEKLILTTKKITYKPTTTKITKLVPRIETTTSPLLLRIMEQQNRGGKCFVCTGSGRF